MFNIKCVVDFLLFKQCPSMQRFELLIIGYLKRNSVYNGPSYRARFKEASLE